ncbi:Nicotinamide adenine dinucleotide transporter 1, chloroplastic [Balamuthia mandrillaris]
MMKEGSAALPSSSASSMAGRPQPKPWQSGGIGAVAAVLTNFTLYPLDLLRTRLQAQAHKEVLAKSRFRAIRAVLTQTWQQGGVRGFYVGLIPGLIGPTTAWASFMLAYKWGQQNPYLVDALNVQRGGRLADFIAGLQAGVVMTLVTNPIFVVKTRMQTSPSDNHFLRVMYEVFKIEGLRGMYRGLVPALPLTCHGAVHFTFFEWFKRMFLSRPNRSSESLNAWETLAAASSSKLCAAALTYPLQVIKTCLQTQKGSEGLPLRIMIVNIYSKNGLRGYYSGFLPHLMRTVPSSTITLFLIERLTQLLFSSS